MAKEKFAITPRIKAMAEMQTSRVFLISSCVFGCIAIVTTMLAFTLPYWVYISGTMETTVAGLTDSTELTYYYGLLRYCLTMKATHLDRDTCEDKSYSSLTSFETTTFLTTLAGMTLMLLSVIQMVLQLQFWNKLFLLVTSTITAAFAAICLAVGVSLYEIYATVQVLDIGGLTTADFQHQFLSYSFWLAVTGGVTAMVTTLLMILGVFTWKKPKEPRKVYGAQYKTTVRRQKFPYRGRQPAVITVTQM